MASVSLETRAKKKQPPYSQLRFVKEVFTSTISQKIMTPHNCANNNFYHFIIFFKNLSFMNDMEGKSMSLHTSHRNSVFIPDSVF
jgi:hypothetical protein